MGLSSPGVPLVLAVLLETSPDHQHLRPTRSDLSPIELPSAREPHIGQYLARYERERKGSSYNTAKSSLARFRADFGDRPLASIERHEATEWAELVPPSRVPIVVTLLNAAVDQELIAKNPFRGLGQRTRGRRDEHPPTAEEFDRLLAGCGALGDYAPQMQALLIFGAYTGMRPGELFALEWSDIDFKANRVHVQRRLYRGSLDLPKSNKARTIALPPPARDALYASNVVLLRAASDATPTQTASETA